MARERGQERTTSSFRERVKQFVRFGMVGTAGFIADAGALKCLLWLGAGLFFGRIGSYLAAVTATWLLNRHYTFAASPRQSGRFREWMRFAISQCSGALINIVIYSWLVFGNEYFSSRPVLAVAIGSMAGMTVNFVAACFYVFPRMATNDIPSGNAGVEGET